MSHVAWILSRTLLLICRHITPVCLGCAAMFLSLCWRLWWVFFHVWRTGLFPGKIVQKAYVVQVPCLRGSLGSLGGGGGGGGSFGDHSGTLLSGSFPFFLMGALIGAAKITAAPPLVPLQF